MRSKTIEVTGTSVHTTDMYTALKRLTGLEIFSVNSKV